MTYLLHPSSVAKIMPEPKAKGEILSVGAKTYLNQLAKELVYGFRERIDTKPMRKGIECEQDSIDLYNDLFFTSHTKNTERRSNDILTGEADIVGEDLIIDLKTAWSLATFPATPEEAHSDLYEWQGRAYMLLWDKPFFELAYCLVDTPESLIGYEQPELHYVSHIPAHMRVTRVRYKREAEKELRLIEKCQAAQVYIAEQIERIKAAHAV